MKVALFVLLGWMLLRAPLVMDEVSAACRLFVTAVAPGLLPYMTLSQLAVSRLRQPVPPWMIVLLGWGGGSPTGATLVRTVPLTARQQKQIAVTCATMSPMFLLGTVGRWLSSPVAAVCVTVAVLAGGCLAGWLAARRTADVPQQAISAALQPLSLAQAVERTMRTLLMICGTMALMRTLAALLCEALHGLPAMLLPLTTLLEVTTGAAEIAALPLPLSHRAALLAGATGFGGAAILLQNRAMLPEGVLSLKEQVWWQAVHGVIAAGGVIWEFVMLNA